MVASRLPAEQLLRRHHSLSRYGVVVDITTAFGCWAYHVIASSARDDCQKPVGGGAKLPLQVVIFSVAGGRFDGVELRVPCSREWGLNCLS